MEKSSVRGIAEELNIPHKRILYQLKEAGVETGRGIKVRWRDVFNAINRASQDVKKELEKAKLKIAQEEGELKEIERRLKQNEVVLMSEVNDLMVKIWNPVARALKDMDQNLAPKCNPVDQVLAREALGKFKRKICKDIVSRCSKLKK